MRNKDILLGLVLTVLVLAWGYLAPETRTLDLQGAALATAATLPLIARRRWPIPVLAVHVALSTAYNTLDYPHDALMPPALVALYTVISTGNRIWGTTAAAVTCVIVLAVRAIDDQALGIDALSTLGWLVAAIVLGKHARQRNANHAKQTRQQVTEERLRIARDLHDLLAHTITTIRVQASVAAHLTTDTTQPLDRDTVARTLNTITDACDQARTELRSTVEVLRDPMPVLPNITDLGSLVRAVGIDITFDNSGTRRPLPPHVEIAAYRIVQESLTNIVKHSNATTATVHLDYGADMLTVTVSDNGTNPGDSDGHGIIGMTERARTIDGTLTIHTDNGFTITAHLPTGQS
ncbi:sensor histidine kinase [Kibdelosporangium philippinense]|uniref:histidine kinase n=1 Tax=Kibdelosporangium philippinense TaxID=211113 RepID=A0ABS8Z884_9PSEU|nr:sensor histidine kinase [Kibdelosporangium philippinense]MCE7004088.1 sensor histidine kinase [Kibdelosporangium philippinense]